MEFVGLEMTGFDYKKLSPDVFVTELGEPTSKRGNDWRWGTKGSFSVKLTKPSGLTTRLMLVAV